jgi:hypothetical protein
MSLQFYLLVNAKQIGIVLAVIAFAAILTDMALSDKKERFILNTQKIKRELIYLLLPVISCFITYASWYAYIKIHKIQIGFSNPALPDLLKIFGINAPSYYNTTIINFVHSFFSLKQYGIINFSFFLWSILITIVLYYVCRLRNSYGYKKFSTQLVIIIGLSLYSGVILIMYLTAFSEYESTIVASFDRYIGTYFLGLLVVALLLAIESIIRDTRGAREHLPLNFKIFTILFVFLCLAPINYIVDNTVLERFSNADRRASRLPYEDMRQYEKLLNRKKDSVFIVSQNTTGQDYYILRYNFTPIRTQSSPPKVPIIWSLGKPYSSKDQWTADISVDKWSKILENFTYVYLYKIDDRFIKDYGQLFDDTNSIKSTTMYRVYKINNNVTLKPVQ